MTMEDSKDWAAALAMVRAPPPTMLRKKVACTSA